MSDGNLTVEKRAVSKVTKLGEALNVHPLRRISAILADIQLPHSVFALPFALTSAHIAFISIGGYRWDKLLAILVCMVTARTAAMTFNRYLDRDIDSINPRTMKRAIPSKRALASDALWVVGICSLIFILACWYLGPLPFGLSLPTLAFLLGYSASKRFTAFTHGWLGAALGIAPAGAWIAVTGELVFSPIVLSLAVLLWVAGFDIIYSLQDIEFDKAYRIFSAPVSAGPKGALYLARAMHLASLVVFWWFGKLAGLGWFYWIVLLVISVLLVIEHSLVKLDDLSKVGIAFFTMNGIISVLFYLGVLITTYFQPLSVVKEAAS